MSVVLCHEIWQMGEARDYPVVTHEFRGDTREQAYAIYFAHMRSDAFLRGCVENDSFLMDGAVVKCTVRWWYDDDDARIERIARAWTEAKRGRPSPGSAPHAPAFPEAPSIDDGAPRGFRPRVIEGGASPHVAGGGRLPGHEDHDPNVCDVRTG